MAQHAEAGADREPQTSGGGDAGVAPRARWPPTRYVSRLEREAGDTARPLPPALDIASVVQLLHRVREYGLRLSSIRTAVEEHLASQETTAEAAIRSEHQRQAADQVSVANAITSLRLCSVLDWRQYFESVSLVEQVLQRDPAGAYGRMDFLSRDRQRQAVEELAAPSGDAQVQGRAEGGRKRAPGGRQRIARRSRRPRRLPPHRSGAARPRSRRRLSAATREPGHDVWCSRTRRSSTWVRSRS